MSAKKRYGRSTRKSEVDFLKQALYANGHAIEEGPKKKTWSTRDLKNIKPKTDAQEEMFQAWFSGKHVCASGSAGTGKTFLAFYLALTELFDQRVNRIIIVRSAVATREVGFLPGTLEEKQAMYELPYHDICAELVGRNSTYRDMKEAGLIEFMTTSFVRGLTWDNAVVIVDETQNMTFHEINSIMTRIGENSRIILTGDTKQTDLDGRKLGSEGMTQALRVFGQMGSFASVHFTKYDIVRSDFVKSWIVAVEHIT
jgi:phosphate starvation-inducible PhoH-like protein